MPNAVVEGLFLLAFFAPPLVVGAGALSLIVRIPSAGHSAAQARAARLAH